MVWSLGWRRCACNHWRCRNVQVDMRCVIVMAAMSLISGCGTDTPLSDSIGRVSGHALAGPTCPVELPGDPNCQPNPVQGSVQFSQGEDVVSSISLDAEGGFAAEVPAGTYTVTVDTGDTPFPVCTPVDVEVQADADAVVDISCDTGIR